MTNLFSSSSSELPSLVGIVLVILFVYLVLLRSGGVAGNLLVVTGAAVGDRAAGGERSSGSHCEGLFV